jgi:purine nucleosidase
MKKQRILIDTDIGDDADDALAIGFALKSPEVELVGITTVFRNVAVRAKITGSLLRTMNREDVPVYPGCGQPINTVVDINHIPCQYYESSMKHMPVDTSVHGVDFIIQQVMKYPNELTIVPIGALTNVALAILKAPEIKGKIKEIVLMGGAFYFQFNEYNILCDPEAAKIVFDSGIPIRAVGLDVTLQCPVTDDVFAQIKNRHIPLTDLLVELLLSFKKVKGRFPFLHDPLAVYAVFDTENIVEFRNEEVGVELRGEFTRGMTFNKNGRDREKAVIGGNVKAAWKVDAKRFTNLYLERILS